MLAREGDSVGEDQAPASLLRGGRMIEHEDFAYYRRRAAVEASRAAGATNPKVAAVHRKLAEHYLAVLRANKGGSHEERLYA